MAVPVAVSADGPLNAQVLAGAKSRAGEGPPASIPSAAPRTLQADA